MFMIQLGEIVPGDEDGDQRHHRHTVKAGAHAAGDNLAQLDHEHGHAAAQGHVAVVHGVHAAVGGAGGGRGPDRGGGRAETDLLAFHVHLGVCMSRCQSGGRLGFRGVDGRRCGEDEDGHDGHQRAGVLAGQDHAPEGHDTGVAEDVHFHDLDQVGDRVRILERVRGVGVEQPAAVGAELLDRLLAGGGVERDGLLGAFQGRGRCVGRQGLGFTQRDKGQGDHDRQGQQHVEADPGQIDPEIAQALAPVSGERPRQGGRDGDARGGRQEVVAGQTGHLGEARERGLGHVGLPVGVGDEADRGVERQVRRAAGEVLRVHRQQVLEPEDQVQHHEAGRAERQHGHGVGQPSLALLRLHAEGRVAQSLDRPQHRVQPGALALPDARQIDPQRPGEDDGDADGEGDFAPASRVHGEVSSLDFGFVVGQAVGDLEGRRADEPGHQDDDGQRHQRVGPAGKVDHLRPQNFSGRSSATTM